MADLMLCQSGRRSGMILRRSASQAGATGARGRAAMLSVEGVPRLLQPVDDAQMLRTCRFTGAAGDTVVGTGSV